MCRSVSTVDTRESPACYFISQFRHTFLKERILLARFMPFQRVFWRKDFTMLKNPWHQSRCPNLESGWPRFIHGEKQQPLYQSPVIRSLSTHGLHKVSCGSGVTQVWRLHAVTPLSRHSLTPCWSALAADSHPRMLQKLLAPSLAALESSLDGMVGLKGSLSLGKFGTSYFMAFQFFIYFFYCY